MNIQVTPHTITITQDTDINSGEYNVTTLNFEFSEEYNNITKMAIFSTCENFYKTPILNNQCTIPSEVLEEQGNVLLGVYGYEGDGENLTLRYSPTPKYFNILNGSYRQAGDPEIPPKSEWEQLVEEVNEAIDEANNLNIEAEKEDNKTTITITHKDGEEQQVEILDGEKGDKGDKGEPGAIKMQIVNELPETGQDDTIYLVPITPDTSGNNYAEYIYINGEWELLGKIGVQVDLTDYVKFTDYASSSKGGVIKYSTSYGLQTSSGGTLYGVTKTYQQYNDGAGQLVIDKGTLENVITGKDLTTKGYVDGLVGNIQTLLDTLNSGNGV